MDTVSHLIRLARIDASLDTRCMLAGATRFEFGACHEHEAPFHVLLEGTCLLRIGSRKLSLVPGDVVVIPSGAPHTITTPGRGRPQGVVKTSGDVFTTVRSARGGESVIDLFCGHYTFGPGAGTMLLRSLPDPVHASFGQPAGSGMLQTLSSLMRNEAQWQGAGTAVILSSLSTVLLAMVLRTSRGLATGATLWTAAGDNRIAAVIERVLDDPGADWSISRLSAVAAMSRATFIRHFQHSTAMTVGAFVTRARLMTAAELLRSGDDTVAAIAARVGYRSESAFSRAFRTASGTTPARFRRSFYHAQVRPRPEVRGPAARSTEAEGSR
ncbi:AraC family transcriptional regulator [Dactylosporangium sp. NBC_01737]|uniref:AraC family transcriptional regulator n=1 Tax=Dactylosporangium sp. NBC_01737 TaxID=2975959 RepID=UPI002E0F22CC|nr:AraC family transcriptional regulator [Dactylosporangium sp. NBC_01737]